MEDNNFLSRIANIASDTLFGPSAEAKMIHGTKSGADTLDTTIPYEARDNIEAYLGKAPKTKQEFYDLIEEKFRKELDNPENKSRTAGQIINAINHNLSIIALNKLGVKTIDEIPEKIFDAWNVPKDYQKQMHQVLIEQPKTSKNLGGMTYPLYSKKDIVPEELGTSYEKIGKKNLNAQNLKENWGIKGTRLIPDDVTPQQLQVLSKIPFYSDQQRMAAGLLMHEAGGHARQMINPEILKPLLKANLGSEQVNVGDKNLFKEIPFLDALNKLKFKPHFYQQNPEGYQWHEDLGQLILPDVFPQTKQNWPAIKQQPTPTPTPDPTSTPAIKQQPKNAVDLYGEREYMELYQAEIPGTLPEDAVVHDYIPEPEDEPTPTPTPIKFPRTKTKTSKKK